MKKLSRFIFFIFCVLLIGINSISVYAVDPIISNNWGEQSQSNDYDSSTGEIVATNNSGDILTGGFGIYIKLIKYDKNTKIESIVGTPILLYSGGLLDDIREVDDNAKNASSSTIENNSPTKVCVGKCDPRENPELSSEGNFLVIDVSENPVSYGQQVGEVKSYSDSIVFTVNLKNDNGTWVASDNCTKSSTNVYSAEVLSYYKNRDIRFLFSGSIYDANISNNIKGNTVTSNGVTIIKSSVNLKNVSLYNYIKQYLLGSNSNYSNNDSKIFRDNNGNGSVTISKILSAFKIGYSDIDITQLDNYYFSFEPVTREKTNVVESMWSTTQRSTSSGGQSTWLFSCEFGGTKSFTSSSQPSQGSNGCRKEECYNTTVCEKRDEEGICVKWESEEICNTRNGKWNYVECGSYRYTNISVLITQHYEKVSVIQPARYGTRNSIISTLTTSITQEESKHCVLNKNNECTGVYEYFIGPNLNTALVGTTGNNKYQLYNGTQAFTKESAKINAVGVSYWWLPDLTSCKKECTGASNSDELLKCAENYCDNSIGYDERANTQQLKAQCITGLCGYQYTPVSCSNSNPYLNQATGVQDIASSSICGFLESDGSPTDGNKRVTTSCVSDTTDVFDAKTYINIACKETSSFQFTDLSNKKLVAGQGLDYYTKLKGNKECTVFFDLNTWKFAYASYHSEDVIRLKDGTEKTARQLLVDMLNYYNSGITASGSSAIGIDMSGQELETTWNDLNYNINKVSVKTKVTEIVNNIKITSSEYTLTPTVQNIDNKLDISGNQSTMMFENLVGKRLYVNKYIHTSNADVSYTFDKYCVSNDGTATVYKAPDNGVCYTTGSGGSLKTVLGKNLYYTNLNATANKDFSDEIKKLGISHAIDSTKATVEDENTGVNYVEDDDYCPYEIDGNNLQCTIVVTANEGTEMHGNGIYANGSVTAKLYVQESLGTTDKVATKSITSPNASMSNIMDDSVVIDISDKKNGVEQLSINGTVTTEKGKKATCNKTIYIINPDSNCGVSCSVEEYNGNNVYEIRSTGRQTPKQYQTALSTNMNWIVVFPDITTRKYLVRVSDPKIDTIVYGKVEGTMLTTNEKCYNVCWSDVPELSSCPNEYEAADTNGIKEYCESNWDMDINNYENVDECVNSCSRARMCADNRRDIKEVTDTCTNNYLEWGFSDPSNCINYCYYCPECSSDYIYRPVNNYNPFPYSSDSNTLGFNYQTGDRIVPSNWVGKTGYIKQDDKDTTSVTGVNSNQKAEYVIELTPSTIRSIRSDTESYNSETSGNDAYLDYVYMQGVDTTKRYYSKFINETFRSYFTMINGETVK